VRHQGDVGVVGDDLGHGTDHIRIAQKAQLPGGGAGVFQHGAGLLGHRVGVQGLGLEDLGRVSDDHARAHRQGVRPHGGDGGDVGAQAGCPRGLAGVEAQHAGRRTTLGVLEGRGGVGRGMELCHAV